MNSLFAFCFAVASLSVALAQTPAGRAEFAQGVQPQLAASADGRVWLVYSQVIAGPAASGNHGQPAGGGGHGDHQAGHGKGKEGKGGHTPQGRMADVWVASSGDGGATFSAPTKVAHVAPLLVGNRRGPRIAARGDRVTVTLVGPELVAYTSRDAGATWSPPVTINDAPDSAREGLHDLAISPAGELFVTWLDLRSGKTELWGAASRDGVTWGRNQLIYQSPGSSICECCHPSAVFDAQGHLAVMWRNSLEGSRDMWLATRAPGAARFTAARKLGEGTWKINGCPHDGGAIFALGAGKFGAVYQRAGEVFLLRDHREVSLGQGRQAVAVAAGNGPVVVWNDGADLVARRPAREGPPAKHAKEARFPSAVALPDGQGAVVAYERGPKDNASVAVERLPL